MTTLSIFLGDEHVACDHDFALAENAVASGDWPAARLGFQRFLEDIQRHVRHEEDLLFPAFEARTGMVGGPTQVMRQEHRQMDQMFDAMADALVRTDDNAYLGLSETVLMLIRQHNLKEENILYPMAEKALAGEGEALLARMQNAA